MITQYGSMRSSSIDYPGLRAVFIINGMPRG